MKVVTAQEMQGIDKKTIERFGVPGHVLMERAGVAVASRIKEIFFEKKKVIILAGGGNNGGDGIVAARELHHGGWNVKVLLLIREDRLSPDCLAQFRIAKQVGVAIEFRNEITDRDLHGAVVVDALLGTGINKEVGGAMAKAIRFLNDSASPVVSVDIPSGISSDSGQVMGIAVRAGYTVTFGLPKRGHLLYPGAAFAGRLFIENIGFPEQLLTAEELSVDLIEKDRVSSVIPRRERYSHKGDYGHVLVVAGSRGKTGAALMAARACLRSGAGLVTIGVPESLMPVFESRVTEEMALPLPDRGDGTLSSKAVPAVLEFLAGKIDALCIGPGIAVSVETQKLMTGIIASSHVPTVVDADGINALSDSNVLKKAQAPVIVTPHPGEMARLLAGLEAKVQAEGKKAQESGRARIRIEEDRIGTAVSFSREMGICLVLKGVPTVIADPEGRACINPTGNPGMATAGAGDVLTGMIGSFLGQGLNPLDAAILGVYLHGLAGDIGAYEKGMHSLTASDIIESLPAAFRDLQGGASR